jgi:hypothetical protein
MAARVFALEGRAGSGAVAASAACERRPAARTPPALRNWRRSGDLGGCFIVKSSERLSP